MKKWYLPVAVIIMLILLGITIKLKIANYKLEKSYTKLIEAGILPKPQLKTNTTIIERIVDKFGSEHVTVNAKENTYPASILKTDTDLSVLDTIAMALDIKTKQVEQLTRVVSHLKAERLQGRYVVDSLKRRIVKYTDEYVDIAYTPNELDTVAGKFDFMYNANLNIAQYYKRKWVLGAKDSYVDIWSTDNRVKINKVDRVTIKPNQKKFGLTLQAVTGFDLAETELGYGYGVDVKLGRFSIQPTRVYQPSNNKWLNKVTAKYDILRL